MAAAPHHLHLVSDATGETINSVTRACLVQFEGVEPIEHSWTLIRTAGQMEKVLQGIEKEPGLVLFTIVNEGLRAMLQDGCRRLQAPCIPVLEPVIAALGSFFGLTSRGLSGRQHELDAEYFARIDAMSDCRFDKIQRSNSGRVATGTGGNFGSNRSRSA